jgi:branched-chain amino acid transport system permease protein
MQYVALAIHGLTLGSIYALVALGFHLVYRAAGVLDFAQGDKVVIGGLAGLTLLHQSLPLILAFLLVAVGGLVAGVAYDGTVIAPTLRRGLEPATIATVGALLVMGSGHILIWGATGEAFPALISGTVPIGQSRVQTQDFLIWGVVALAVLCTVGFLTRTRYGKGLVAASSDAMAAGTVGIDVRRTRVVAGSLAFGLAALAGVLVAPLTLAGGTIGPSLTVRAFTGAILGGLESTWGVVAGSLLLGLFEDLVGSQVPYAYLDPLVFSVLILVLLVFPSGLFGLRRRTV